MEYAVETLEVPLIVVLGHHDCQAMRTAMRAWSDGVLPEGAARAVVEQAIGSIVRRGTHAASIDSMTSAHIVETGLSLLQRSPVISRQIDEGRCGIVCAATCPEDGLLMTYATIGTVGGVEDSLLECV